MAKRLTPEEKLRRQAERDRQREIANLKARITNHWFAYAWDCVFLAFVTAITTPLGGFLAYYIILRPQWEKKEVELKSWKDQLTALQAAAA